MADYEIIETSSGPGFFDYKIKIVPSNGQSEVQTYRVYTGDDKKYILSKAASKYDNICTEKYRKSLIEVEP